jgi:hypothetical protein
LNLGVGDLALKLGVGDLALKLGVGDFGREASKARLNSMELMRNLES